VTCSVTLLSGFYPALILSGFNPVAAIKNNTSQRIAGRLGLRRGLVVLQFAIAQVLIIGMLIVVSQMEYLWSAPLGFNKDGVLLVPVSNDSLDLPKLNVLKSRLSARAGILDVSFSAFTPIDDSHWTSDFTFDNSGKSTDFEADLKWADPEFFKTYNVRFVAGRVYSPSDTVRGFVVSEMLLKELGIRNPEEGLGKNISFWKGQIVAPIVGVVRDFHSRSLVRPLAPMVFGAWKAEYQVANIKLDIRDSDDILRYVKTVWEETYPDRVFESRFLDQKIEGFYRDQTKLSQLTKIFAALAIFISCLGLYGLVSFMAARRTKEVGIRRVLGASVGNIVQLFSLEFTALTGIAFLIAAPVSYFTMQGWLEDFAFRIDPGAGTFILALLGSAFLAWCTVGYRALRAAMVNPAKSLRYE
jgi:hypothetical protein